MAFFETLKELAGTVVEAVKENPVAAAAIGGGVVVVGGGGYYVKKKLAERSAAKKIAAAPVAPVIAPVAAEAQAEDKGLLGEQFQQPERPDERPASGTAGSVL